MSSLYERAFLCHLLQVSDSDVFAEPRVKTNTEELKDKNKENHFIYKNSKQKQMRQQNLQKNQ